MIKNKIFKYFFSEYIKLFLIISLSFSILIWMTQAARLLDLITEYGNSVEIYIGYLITIYPKILDNIFLLSFLVAMFFLFNKFESSNELNIFLISGIGKKEIVNVCILISILTIFFYLVLATFIAPMSSSKGRELLAKSEFSLINSLVKENNFNSPLNGLTIYVNSNDRKGNLVGVFIYEKNRTIIAETGEVLSDNNKSFLKLYNGKTQEKVNDKINEINFQSTIFDFSQYKLQNVSVLKFSERSIFWLIDNLKSINSKKNEIREEINKRLIKPFFILILCISSCFLLFSNYEKINYFKYKFIIYSVSIFFIILNEILLGVSGKNLTNTIFYLLSIFLIFFTLKILLNKFLKFETK
jgi:lipopolysaccharide export system permease protein